MADASTLRALEASLNQQIGLSALRILVLEDQHFQRRFLVRMLDSVGVMFVREAGTREEAVQIASSEAIDLVFCGLQLSVMDGLEFLGDLAEIGQSISVILSGEVSPLLLESVTTLGRNLGVPVLGVLEKPVSVKSLQEMLERQWEQNESPLASKLLSRMTHTDVLRGLDEQELSLHFQPTVSLKNRGLVGCEALLRWNHPELGVLSAESFLETLEHEDIAERITHLVVERSLEALRFWMQHGLWLGVYVNLSEAFLSMRGAANQILALAFDYPEIEPRLVTFDVTEEALANPSELMLQNLERLRAKGFNLALDNYTACATLEQVRRVPFTDLKLNPSLMMASSRQTSVREMIGDCLRLAATLDLVLVAEGVERGEDWDLVASLGCHLAQGFLIAKPMEAEAFLNWATRFEGAQVTHSSDETTAASADVEPDVGMMLGHYRLDGLLGQGGLGKVFLATDTRLLRSVALKVCLDRELSAGTLDRFVQEARALARVQHPGVVTIYEIGLEPCHYIVMEVLAGLGLDQALDKDGALPPRQAVEYTIQILEALQAVHAKGIVHRDLKPSNIMLDDAGRLRIMDFGIAKILEDDTKITQTGHFCGTPQYMAPEQIDSTMGGIDARADLFAVGTILYEMLTGQPTVTATGLNQILTALLLKVPSSPSELNPRVPKEISDLCMHALLKPKDQRFQSAGAFLEALRLLKFPVRLSIAVGS
jgi:EAL domain-containing protein (putative c-di-GMP-specific phosphodiesterase class I)/CheY-like chemotaxis protein